MTPAESGAIGAACEVPETAATAKVATAIAKTVRIIVVLRRGRTPSIETMQQRLRFRAVPRRFKYRSSKFSDFNFAPLPRGQWNFPPPTVVIY